MNEEIKQKLASLELAQDHQRKILMEQGIHSSIHYYEWDSGWEWEVEYQNVHPEGETQLTFDSESLPERFRK